MTNELCDTSHYIVIRAGRHYSPVISEMPYECLRLLRPPPSTVFLNCGHSWTDASAFEYWKKSSLFDEF
ncbi:Protein of unknown function [Gryllus bimaculatus]|nr:Protein of unknown function [Gryllus bimaculatus]